MYDLTLIIPAKNERESLPKVIAELNNKYKIKVVLKENDYETIEVIKNLNVEIIMQTGNGYGNALIEGIKNCKTEYWCIINADGSMDPKYIKEMLEKCYDKDFVFGTRYKKPGGGSDDDTLVTFIGNKFFSFIGNIMFNLNLTDILYTYVMGKKKSFEKLKITSSDFRFCVELPIKAKKANLKFIDLPSYERARIGGKKKVNAIKDGFLILLEMFTLFLKK